MEIYELKSKNWGRKTALSLAKKYGVTTKAVRDIWRGRTWSDVTFESSYKLKRGAVRNCSDVSAKTTEKRRKTSDDCETVTKDMEKVKRMHFVTLKESNHHAKSHFWRRGLPRRP